MNGWINEYEMWANTVCSAQLLICFVPHLLGQAEGQGDVFVTHQAHARKHPPSYGFWIPHCSILLSFSLLLFACTERKTKSSLMIMMFNFLHLPAGVSPLSPSSGHVASTLNYGLYEAMQLIPLTFSAFCLHLIPFPHLYLFSQLVKHLEQSFSSPATLSWLKQSLKTLYMTCINRASHTIIFSFFIPLA